MNTQINNKISRILFLVYLRSRTYFPYFSHMLVQLYIQIRFWSSLSIMVSDSDKPVTYTIKYCTKRNSHNLHTDPCYVTTHTYHVTKKKKPHEVETYTHNGLEEQNWTRTKPNCRETKTWNAARKWSQNKETWHQKWESVRFITARCHSNHPLNSWWAFTLGKFVTVMAQINSNRNPILIIHMENRRYISDLFGTFTWYHLIQLKLSDKTLNMRGLGKMVKSIQSKCMTQT